MNRLFSMVVTMSLTGGIVIVLVLVMRLIFMRLPKIFSYLLWGVVLLRLLCPFSFSSELSVFQVMDSVVTKQGMIKLQGSDAQPQAVRFADGKADGVEEQISAVYAAEGKIGADAEKIPVLHIMQKQTEINTAERFSVRGMGTAIWILGIAVLWLYSISSVFRLRGQLIGAVPDEKSDTKNIYLCDYICTAFVVGVLRPRIYLPTTITETERHYILLHEKTHIKRGDHIFRLLAFLALSLHWFNPLVWCAFFLSEKDMEMSCDEAVMRQMGTDLRAAYSASLLNLASGKKIFAGAPLCFGEGSVKSRIKNIMRYKKTAVFVGVPACILVGITLVALGSNPAEHSTAEKNHNENAAEGERHETDTVAKNNTDEKQGTSVLVESEHSGETIAVYPAVVTDQMVCDIEGPVLDYADGETLIFHHYFGLFIYKIGSNRLDSSVNLKELGCLDAEGKLNCEIYVTRDGQKIYLHPLDTEELYLYDVVGRRLTREVYDREYYSGHIIDFFVPLMATANCVDPDHTVWRSRKCAMLRGDQRRYLYLECGSGMVMDLYYVVETGVGGERVQYARIFDEQPEAGGLFEYASYTGYLDECTAWEGWNRFVNQDYDGDGKTDRVYRKDIVPSETCRYRIEFGNGDVLETDQLGMGMPVIQTCDLNGDGSKEILIQLSYGFSTDPCAYGETALFEKKNGSYEPLMPPEELCTYMKGNDNYNPSITVVCRQLGEEFPESASMPKEVWDAVQTPQMHVTVKELSKTAAVDEIVPLNQDAAYLFDEPDTTMEHQSISYKTEIVSSQDKDLLEFYFEAINKWSLDKIVVTAAYQDGALHVVGSRYVQEAAQYTNDR